MEIKDWENIPKDDMTSYMLAAVKEYAYEIYSTTNAEKDTYDEPCIALISEKNTISFFSTEIAASVEKRTGESPELQMFMLVPGEGDDPLYGAAVPISWMRHLADHAERNGFHEASEAILNRMDLAMDAANRGHTATLVASPTAMIMIAISEPEEGV